MRLIIVRHGETEENRKNVIQGQRHGRLSRTGRSQVERLAAMLKDEKIDFILSSDLRRAVHTVSAIARFHEAPVHHVKALREISMGVYEGKEYRLFDSDVMASGLHRARFRPKGGESYEDLRKRLKRFSKGVYKKYGDKTVLLSTHGTTIRCLLSIYLDIPLERAAGIHTRNAGAIILNVGESSVSVIRDEMTGIEDWKELTM